MTPPAPATFSIRTRAIRFPIIRVMVNRRLRVLTDEEIADIAAVYQHYREVEGKRQEIPGFCKPATLDDAAERRLLTRYVGAWEAAEVGALLELLVEDATLSMPPARGSGR